MTLDEVNEAEWKNPDNWSGSFLGFYFSKRDSRIFVPKKLPWLGWTLNMAHSAGVHLFFIGILSLLRVFFLVALAIVAA